MAGIECTTSVEDVPGADWRWSHASCKGRRTVGRLGVADMHVSLPRAGFGENAGSWKDEQQPLGDVAHNIE